MSFRIGSHFIGRHEEREQIKELLVSAEIQVLQIYGLPSVGKTALIRQVCQEISSELEAKIIFKRITNGLWPNTEISQFLQDIKDSKILPIIVLDCFENFSDKEEFNQLCLENFWNFHRLKIILVFQGSFPINIGGIPDERIQVKPMKKEDARCLFYRRTKVILSNNSEQLIDELIDHCGALPGQIIELTNKISQFPPDASLAELYEFVRENKSFCQSEDITVKLNKYIKSLTPNQCNALSEVVYFPGSFTLTDVSEIANYKNDLDAKFKFVYPLLSQGLLKSMDEDNQQFQVPALFQDYANQQLAHLRHEDTTKLKFSSIIGKTLIEAEHLWKNGLIYDALGIMTNNWKNVQKLLLQAIHSPSDGNSFQIYYKVVIAAGNVISLCYPNEAKLFCRAIVDNAQIFGSEDQQALSMASYGHTLVTSAEKEALQLYKTSEGILRKHNNHSYQLIILLYNMSSAYYRCGELQNGIRCAKEALSIQVMDQDADEVEHVRTYAASFLAYNLIFATEYEQAEKIIRKTLQEVGETGHPAVPTLLNSFGLKEERSGGDPNKALTWYLASLAKKRKVAEFQEHLLVTTLCNVAGQLSKTKGKHDFALKFLFEAEGIRRRAGWVHAYSGLVVWNIGMVFMRKQMQFEAVVKIKEAERLYGTVNPNHYVNAEVKIWLAHCHLLLDNAEEAKQLFLEIFRNKKMYQELRPQGEFVLNSLEHLIHLSIRDPQEQQTYITELLKELPRLNHCPGVGAICLKKYHLLLIKYSELLLKLSNGDAKSEPRSGIFLECIPDNCLACKEVINYDMCPKDIYLQKMNLLTPICQFTDRTDSSAARSLVSCEQSENAIRRKDLRTTKIPKEYDNQFLHLNSESSTESFNSNILPSPVRELCKSSTHSESVEALNGLKDYESSFPSEDDIGNNQSKQWDIPAMQKLSTHSKSAGNYQKEPNDLPHFNALFSFEESGVDCEENNRFQTERNILAKPKSSTNLESIDNHQEVLNRLPRFDALFSLEGDSVDSETKFRPEIKEENQSRQNSTLETRNVKSIHESHSSNFSGESVKLFQRNGYHLENKQLWDLESSTRIHQTEPFKENPADILSKNIGTMFSGSSATLEDCETEQKYITPSEQIVNNKERNEFQKSKSILSKLSSLMAEIDSTSEAPKSSSKKSDYLDPSNELNLLNNSQRLKTNSVQEQQRAEQFWKNCRWSQNNSVNKTESKKPCEKTKLDPLKNKNTTSIYTDLRKNSTLQKPFSTKPAELNLLNGCSNSQTFCDDNFNSKFLSLRHRMSDKSMNQVSPLKPRFFSANGPVEHEERHN